MNPTFRKLNFKDQPEIVVLNPPESFQSHLEEMIAQTSIQTTLEEVDSIQFIISFVTQQEELDRLISEITPKLEGDAVLWFVYPKKTSKNYSCDFNRDTGFKQVEELGLLGVRAVAIDEDWSALRFRKKEYIKKVTRKS